jgi:hypothetical protein
VNEVGPIGPALTFLRRSWMIDGFAVGHLSHKTAAQSEVISLSTKTHTPLFL